MLPLRNTEMQFAYPWFAVDFCSIWPFNGTWPLFLWSSRFIIVRICDDDRVYITIHEVQLARYPPGNESIAMEEETHLPSLQKGYCMLSEFQNIHPRQVLFRSGRSTATEPTMAVVLQISSHFYSQILQFFFAHRNLGGFNQLN